MVPNQEKRMDPSVGKRFPFRMAHVCRTQGYLVSPHWHDHLEFLKVIEGPVVVTLDNQKFTAIKDDIIFVNSGQIHAVETSEGEARIMGMIFDKFFITNFLEGFETKHMYTLFINIKQRQSLFPSLHPLWQELNECIENSDRENKRRDMYYEMAIKSHIYKLMTAILRHYNQQLQLAPTGNTLPAVNHFAALRPVLDYIAEHYAEPVYLEDLCVLVNMSPYHFSRTFKKMIGTTIPSYVSLTRINMAKKMLIESELSITEIAERTGFCNTTYFGKVFKETTGVSPMQFKNEVISRCYTEGGTIDHV